MICNNRCISPTSLNRGTPLQGQMPNEDVLPISSAEKLRIARRRRSSQFTKRRTTILRKAHELYKDCGVDIYIAVRNKQNNQMWQYSNGYIPPSILNEVYPVPIILTPQDFRMKK